MDPIVLLMQQQNKAEDVAGGIAGKISSGLGQSMKPHTAPGGGVLSSFMEGAFGDDDEEERRKRRKAEEGGEEPSMLRQGVGALLGDTASQQDLAYQAGQGLMGLFK